MARRDRRGGRRQPVVGERPARPAPGPLGRLFGRGRRDATPGPASAAGEPEALGVSKDVSAAAPEPEEAVPEQRGKAVDIKRLDGSALRGLLLAPDRPGAPVPGMLWIHGDDPTDVPAPSVPAVAELLFDHRPCVVLCLDHPEDVHDCHLALSWLKRKARVYGMAEDQLMVGGEGAGANMAIRLSSYERDQGFVSIAWQLPLYPSLAEDWRDGLPSMARHFGYRGLPQTTTVVGMDDPAREAAIAFVEGMRKDGVEVDFHMYRGRFSGTGMCGDTPGAREARSFILRQFDDAAETCHAAQPNVLDLDVPSVG